MDKRMSLLKELCDAYGPSGCESNVADIIRRELVGLCDEIDCLRDGSVIAKLCGDGSTDKRFMLNAHMDEVGFMVTHIDDEGYLHVCNVGGIDPRVICGRRVVFGNENGWVKGIVASKAIHQQTQSERSEATPIDAMYVDIGALNKEDAEKYVNVGDFGTFDCDFVEFGNGKLRAKAIDDRLGCAAMIDVLKNIKSNGVVLPFDLYCAFSTREEIGGMGALMCSYKIDPHVGIVIESTAVSDVAGTPEHCCVGTQGEGGCISLLDYSSIYDPEFVEYAMDIGKKNDIKCQLKRFVSGGNDARHLQRSRAGALVLAISAPTRYIHTPSNVISIDDYHSICNLVYCIVTQYDRF